MFEGNDQNLAAWLRAIAESAKHGSQAVGIDAEAAAMRHVDSEARRLAPLIVHTCLTNAYEAARRKQTETCVSVLDKCGGEDDVGSERYCLYRAAAQMAVKELQKEDYGFRAEIRFSEEMPLGSDDMIMRKVNTIAIDISF